MKSIAPVHVFGKAVHAKNQLFDNMGADFSRPNNLQTLPILKT